MYALVRVVDARAGGHGTGLAESKVR
jgi:hypothetical protein